MENVFVLGYWCNAYRASHKEYYWARFDDKKSAQTYGKRKQANGQPKQFYDWCGGGNRYFTSEDKFVAACKLAGFTPNLESCY